jgi:hypothetical protein
MAKNNEDKNYFIATKDEKKAFIIYTSEPFLLSEIDLINLIKICLIEARSKAIGNRLLDIYRDSTKSREHITKERLNLIGVSDEGKPERRKNPRTK